MHVAKKVQKVLKMAEKVSNKKKKKKKGERNSKIVHLFGKTENMEIFQKKRYKV